MADIGEFMQSKTLKASDFPKPQMVTIRLIEQSDEYDGKPLVWFKELDKPLVANTTNLKLIAKLHGRDYTKWGGKMLNLYSTMVEFKGDMVPAIRVKLAGGAQTAKEALGEDEVPF